MSEVWWFGEGVAAESIWVALASAISTNPVGSSAESVDFSCHLV